MTPHDENEPYTRWQGFRIAQLGLCIALFLSFSVATLGFSFNLLIQPTFAITACAAKAFFILSCGFGFLSTVCGALACLTRLEDFRVTAQVARYRGDSSKAAEVAIWRKRYEQLGDWTWALFIAQLALFGLQAILLMFSLVVAYWQRLS
jgi:hypothetical protein